ncbi:DNA-binding transcriptional activator BglJ [Klebsiella sp. I138]|uniref:DNA-binding transcriptional activator BglJ n=1 Tax=Klebsiella sp. I138 TaxID=2755385 RepID=UPI003DA8C915
MEKRNEAQCIAVVEQCVMTEAALRFILNDRQNINASVLFFNNVQSLKYALNILDVTAVIFSLSGHRQLRLESLLFLHEIACSNPDVCRVVLADNIREASLINQLAPFHLHGILNKSTPRETLQEQLLLLLAQQTSLRNEPFRQKGVHRLIPSPIEQSILRCMADGYSLPEIAVQLGRNIKTIRAHKCNAMARLGFSSDLGLLSAADLLIHLPPPCDKDAAEAERM